MGHSPITTRAFEMSAAEARIERLCSACPFLLSKLIETLPPEYERIDSGRGARYWQFSVHTEPVASQPPDVVNIVERWQESGCRVFELNCSRRSYGFAADFQADGDLMAGSVRTTPSKNDRFGLELARDVLSLISRSAGASFPASGRYFPSPNEGIEWKPLEYLVTVPEDRVNQIQSEYSKAQTTVELLRQNGRVERWTGSRCSDCIPDEFTLVSESGVDVLVGFTVISRHINVDDPFASARKIWLGTALHPNRLEVSIPDSFDELKAQIDSFAALGRWLR